MSTSTKQLWEMMLKSIAVVALSLFTYLFASSLNKLDKTYETVIRVEQKVLDMDKNMDDVKTRITTLETKAK